MNAVINITNAAQAFQSAMAAVGLAPPDSINDDGSTHRYSTGKSGSKNGWYFLHLEGIPWGQAGDWAVNGGEPICQWCAKSDTQMTAQERSQHRERVATAQAQRAADEALKHTQAAVQAAAIWKAATLCIEHQYSTTKGVKPYGVRVIEADAARSIDRSLSTTLAGTLLVIPMRNSGGELRSLQFITADGTKRPLTGGQKQGCYHSMGSKPGDVVTVVEGYATGASAHECTGWPTVVAFDAGNLLDVTAAIRKKYPDIQIVMGADDDYQTDGNPGMTKAQAAAQAVGGRVAVPDFGVNRPDKATDFNDLHQISGAAAVRACFDAATSAADVVDEWPELQGLIAKMDPQDYPLDSLPDAVRCAVEEVAGFVKAPVPLIAASALAALSLGIQSHVDVQRAGKLTGPTGLFMLAIADSGERKSTCDGFFTSAIRDYEAREKEAAKPLLMAYKSEHEAWDAQRSGIKEKIKALARDGKPCAIQVQDLRNLDNDEPQPPRVPRLIYGDATPEALTFALATKWPSAGVISSEAGSVFGGHGMGADSVMRNLAALNQLWDGVPLSTERRSSESFTVRGARLTMALQVQEATVRAFFANTKGLARGTGFLARFLISWPRSTQGTRFFTAPPANWPALATFNNRLTAILDRQDPIDEDGALTPVMLTLSPEAMDAWVSFHDSIESMLASGGDLFDVRDVASKTADNAARLAALFHTFSGSIGPIDLEAMESASTIVAWHLSEAQRFLGEIAMPAEQMNQARLETWMLDYCKREKTDKVPTREIQRNGPGAMRDKKAMQEALQELTELGRARPVQEGKRKLIQLRPELLTGAAS